MPTPDLAGPLRSRLSLLLDIDPDSIGEATPFAELQVDSMMRLELISLVEQQVGYEIPERDLPELASIGHVLRYVACRQR